ncbi:MAG: hypothetical protein AAF799_12750 [Myxococcota bacterium]
MPTHDCFRTARFVALLAALPTLSVTSVACDSGEEADDLEMRILEARQERMPAPTPEPEPEPEPVTPEALIGLSLEEAESMLAWNVIYEMDRLPSAVLPYTAAPIQNLSKGWYAHAMQWKEYSTRSFVGNVLGSTVYALDLNAAFSYMQGNGLYHWSVGTQSEVRANALEAGPTSWNGAPIFNADPPGTWMFHNEPDPAKGLVYAALVMHYWGSPVYHNASYVQSSAYNAEGSIIRTIALEELEFMLNAPDLLSACLLPQSTSPSVALSTVPNCAGSTAVLHDDIVATWNISTPWTANFVPYEEAISLDPAHLIQAWNHSSTLGNLVFDPPADATDEDFAALDMIAEAMKDQVLIEDESGTLVRLSDYAAEMEIEPVEG